MCGICGWIDPSGLEIGRLVSMNRRGQHRGPDGEGYWLWSGGTGSGAFRRPEEVEGRPETGVTIGLGHRRLAILDLSDFGIQPMPSSDDEVWVVFNGEVYNYLELRTELAGHGHRFRTGTDTEVVLAAYRQWGTDCFARFNGMWAIVLVDTGRRKLVLSRDRLGIKPLYVWSRNGAFAFSSEIKQLLALPAVRAQANVDAVVEYLDTGYESPPDTFFRDIHAFKPGCWAEVGLDRVELPTPRPFWFPEETEPLDSDLADSTETVRGLFRDAVRLRLRSDVPVGVCLSGGLDSSAVFGQVQTLKDGRGEQTYAFSAAFEDPEYDERPYIRSVLDRFGGRGFATFPGPDGFWEDFSEFIYHHDEPPSVLSQYAAWCVMRLARSHRVPVLLNGQGGDELFTGYWSACYILLRSMIGRSPLRLLAQLGGAMLPGGNPQLITQILPHLKQYRHRRRRDSRAVLRNRWAGRGHTLDRNWAVTAQKLDPVSYKLHEIRWIHLPRLLKWDDRNAMAFGVEARYPFLDHRLLEFAVSIPSELNLHRGWNKYLIRRSLGEVLPPSITWRRDKVGFDTPQAKWIATSMAPSIREWLDKPSAQLLEIVEPARLREFGRRGIDSGSLHRMDESQKLLVRLMFLDRWFRTFDVDVAEA